MLKRQSSSNNQEEDYVRMSTLKRKRLATMMPDMVNIPIMDGEEDVDLLFVVEGDFFDGEEFQPQIVTEGEQVAMLAPGDDLEAEEVVVGDFGDDDEYQYAHQPIIPDDAKSQGSRQTVSTFNYANENKPAFLHGVPNDLS